MKRVLVLFAHPAVERSRVNRQLVAAAREVAGVTVRDLYECAPDFSIDVREEQAQLDAHDVIVFQHPIYWYSVPALLKQWQDLVLEHGWAYGQQGRHLEGKWTLNAVTTGGPEGAYSHDGFNRFTLRELLAPWEATANLCRMRFLAPFWVPGALRLGANDVAPWVARYRRLLEALVAGTLDADAAAALPTSNSLVMEPAP